jgi:thiamine-phosphate pyrophosphorylase
MTTSRASLNLSLYLVLGPEHCARHGLAATVRAALDGGVTLIQYRAKAAPARAQFAEVVELSGICRRFGVPLLVNDRVDIALAAGADGVHLGQSDLPAERARRLLGEDAIVGLTVRSLAEIEAAPLAVVDYLSVGAVYATASKADADPPRGTSGLAELVAAIRRRSELPVCAISGIDAGNAVDVIAAGADGIAVISAICSAEDPAAAARGLREIVAGGVTMTATAQQPQDP